MINSTSKKLAIVISGILYGIISSSVAVANERTTTGPYGGSRVIQRTIGDLEYNPSGTVTGPNGGSSSVEYSPEDGHTRTTTGANGSSRVIQRTPGDGQYNPTGTITGPNGGSRIIRRGR